MDSLVELLNQIFATYRDAAPVRTNSELVNLLFSLLQWLAIVVSAVIGVYEARRRDLDFFGALVIASAVSFGGGTIRDVLLGRTPLFWIMTPIYVLTVLVVALIALFSVAPRTPTTRLMEPLFSPMRRLMRVEEMPLWVIALDALALGLWAYLGTYYTLAVGGSPFVAPVMGMITAAFGGVLRDVFFAQVPILLRRGQLYAVCAGTGSAVYIVLYVLGIHDFVGMLACVFVTFAFRMIVVKYNIQSV